MLIHPILDQYYNHAPSYVRSSGFAVSKGLVSGPSPPATIVGEEAEKTEEEREVGEEEGERVIVKSPQKRGKENERYVLAARNRV